VLVLEVKTSVVVVVVVDDDGGGARFFNFSSFSAASKLRFLSSLEVEGWRR
jgi:hypothetical protein